jgi:hypothetical protein
VKAMNSLSSDSFGKTAILRLSMVDATSSWDWSLIVQSAADEGEVVRRWVVR